MIHHLILLGEEASLAVRQGMLINGEKKMAISVLGSIQCFSAHGAWSNHSLSSLAEQCPVVLSTWNAKASKWKTSSVLPRCRYVNPEATYRICQLSEKDSTAYASALLMSKIENQHTLIRSLNPQIAPLPKLAANSYNRILRLEAKWARFFWSMYFSAAAQDLFVREKRKASAPLNIALNYGYGFLYHALEWQCVASGIEPGIGIIHRLRRSRPSLVCDLIEPFRCCVELTVMRYLDEMHEKKMMSGRFAEMMESYWAYRGRRFRLRSILRLVTESFVRSLANPRTHPFHPFVLHARDACL